MGDGVTANWASIDARADHSGRERLDSPS